MGGPHRQQIGKLLPWRLSAGGTDAAADVAAAAAAAVRLLLIQCLQLRFKFNSTAVRLLIIRHKVTVM